MIRLDLRGFEKTLGEGEIIKGQAIYLTPVPPGNHLETLSGGREGQHSIRVNRQHCNWFSWTNEGPANLEIVDYH